ncbi:MAG TPA: hypothetical protein VKR32_11195 [Puia sp.]|nr:hypothetical protein [Puia sp.]
MRSKEESLDALQDIRKMMERSSRFISLSGWSGISAGICALLGAWFGYGVLARTGGESVSASSRTSQVGLSSMGEIQQLLLIGRLTFAAAAVSAFIFTYIRSKKNAIPMWGLTAKRLLINTMVPMIVGGLVILRMMQTGYYDLVGSCSLVFYGLALVNASKYTLNEIRYLGYAELALGLIDLWQRGYGLLFWALGFGVLHIIYGTMMWWKYERVQSK